MHYTIRFGVDALLNKATERGKASAGPDHDDGHLVVHGKAEVGLSNENGHTSYRMSYCDREI